MLQHNLGEVFAYHSVGIPGERFQGNHGTGLYAVIGDFNDTPQSPCVARAVNSGLLTDVVAAHRPVDDRWTYYWRSKNQVSQIDYILASQALAQRVAQRVQADASKIPHIERAGIAYRELNVDGEVLPEEANLIYFEPDLATSAPAGVTPPAKVQFRFPRYLEILDDWKNNISDHCPVKVWF